MPVKLNIPSTNHKLSAIFEKIASCYRYLGSDQRFRALAYEQAAKTLYNLDEDLAALHDVKKLDALKGIGTHIAAKIIEYLDTGKINTYEELKKQVPMDLMELSGIEGIGPATIRHLHDELHVSDRKKLKSALIQMRPIRLKGVDKLKLKKIFAALNIDDATCGRIQYSIALEIALPIVDRIKKISGVINAFVAGSLRRERPDIGDLDILVTAQQSDHRTIIDAINHLPDVVNVISSGTTKTSVKLKQKGMQMDVRVVSPVQEGSALLYFTGSKAFNIELRKRAKQKGYLLNEYGLFKKKDGSWLAGKTEFEIFSALGLTYIAPKDREEAAVR